MILSTADTDKINAWLRSLQRERHQFSSYFLYCEMIFRESETILRGKSVPNRLQTALAFHCLCQATSVFGRHEDVLRRICSDLSAAIYLNHEDLPLHENNIEVLEYFANQHTYYDNQATLRKQKDDIQRELRHQALKYEARMKDEEKNIAKIKDLEAHHKLRELDKVSHRNTSYQALHDKLQIVLHSFKFMDEGQKQKIVLGVIGALRAHITADTLIAITEDISALEKEKLMRSLFHEELTSMTERIRAEVIATSSAQQNVILERSAARITRFQTMIWDRLRRDSVLGTISEPGESRPSTAVDDELCEQDRKVLESINDVMEELQGEKKKTADLEQRLHEAEQMINDLRWKNNVQMAEVHDTMIKHAKEVQELREEFSKSASATVEKEVQTDRSGDGDGMYDEDNGVGSNGKSRGRRRGGATDDDDDLIIKNRRLNKYGLGIASIIEDARIPSSKIRKILSKRKPLTLNELHAIIVGYYQAKMLQDIQDDNVGKGRSNIAQFIMDMYTLHYGLKDLAISQLVFLDASIRKHAAESARVRTFGLLTGCLEPDSHACSVQAIDFFLFVVVVMFNAGIYKKGRKQSVHVAQNLKVFFGEGIFMSPKSVTLKSEVVCTTIDLVFSFTRNEPGGKLDRLKDEIRLICSNQTTNVNGGIEVDMALEKIMNYWFMLYEQHIEDIHAMFTHVDTNNDGILDFREFCEVAQALEPDMDRREVLSVYNKAAGDDHVIDKDEFVQVMLAHQRGVILKEFYRHDSSKKVMFGIQQRKQTYNVSSSGEKTPVLQHSVRDLQYKTLSGAMAHLDREESYASLVAAMSMVTDALQPLVNAPLDDDDQAEDSPSTPQSEGERMQDNVSFVTLSRLSLWASEAKCKLSMSRHPTERSIPEEKEEELFTPLSTPSATHRPVPRSLEPPSTSFEQDINELLEQALAKANIDLQEVIKSPESGSLQT
ncbi:hypothetical protein Poli38472_011283 [Pythium oligandrum]|uniref:Uncharacterized protein n=1 Tax=Pythium oligandrum TaxID=41045 RepID=A0A8K1FRK1_PYTOL|nr:hypothetical protein Poli38472_011283 [Pythium oligandrum]|eukprot:TMW67663.1 hypothetical protein Poli38472_011283 [Pythium oligandrum]